MIRSTIALALSFCLFLMIEASGIWVFDGWFAAIPLMTAAGILVMQRVGIPEGIGWFCVLAFFRGDFVALTIAATAPSLTLRVFSTRSLYALLGIGLVSHAAGIGVLFIISTITSVIVHTSWTVSYTTLWLQELLLIPGLYFGMSIVQWFEQNIRSRIALKSLA
jgi:hypothetical protein